MEARREYARIEESGHIKVEDVVRNGLALGSRTLERVVIYQLEGEEVLYVPMHPCVCKNACFFLCGCCAYAHE